MNTAEGLRGIAFTDMYLGKEDAWLGGVPGTLDPTPIPPAQKAEALELRQRCADILKARGQDDFALRHNDVTYRASVINTLAEQVFVLRRFPDSVPRLETLGIHPTLVDKLTRKGLTGLVIVSGAFGQGKTTTASSIIVSRLATLGGVAVTVENPPEMPLQGRHGEGVCYQTWVEQGQFSDACRKATRWAPSMILLGEIRDSETALEALRAAINGRLLVCTVHGDSAVTAVERIATLASASSGSLDDIAHLLSSGLTCILHQKLDNQMGRRQLLLETLMVEGDDAPGIRSTIAQRKYLQLNSVIQMQKNKLLVGNRPARPVS